MSALETSLPVEADAITIMRAIVHFQARAQVGLAEPTVLAREVRRSLDVAGTALAAVGVALTDTSPTGKWWPEDALPGALVTLVQLDRRDGVTVLVLKRGHVSGLERRGEIQLALRMGLGLCAAVEAATRSVPGQLGLFPREARHG